MSVVERLADAFRLLGVLVMAPLSRRAVHPRDDESARLLPGDELVGEANLGWTHAVTIDARPSEIWPWLVQMGCRRAGWYSYDGLDNGGVRSADRVLPQFQRVQVGDVFPQTPLAKDRFVVRVVEPERSLVLGDDAGSMSWAFVLRPVDATSTRVVTRSRGSYDRLALGLMLKLLWHPVHFGMQRRQLLNLRRLAEADHRATRRRGGGATTLKLLVGSGDKIMLFALPVLLIGVAANVVYPSVFRVGGPSRALAVASIVALVAGVTIWIWSVILILTKVPRGELITTGPYRLVKHPLYTGVALLVLPWIGFLLNSSLGAVVGIVLYLGSRRFSPEEEAKLSATFGTAWDLYCGSVKMPWL